MFGLFLAYETRSIKVKQINDSRYVGMSIYNVVILCLITAPVTMVIANQQDASFVFVSLAIIFCCFLSLALIFIPKVIEVIRHPKDKAESKYNPDQGSKEDEEKYQKLLNENEDLQKLIAQVSFLKALNHERSLQLLHVTISFTERRKDSTSKGWAGGKARIEGWPWCWRTLTERLADCSRLCDRRGNFRQCNRWGYIHYNAFLSSFRFWFWIFRVLLVNRWTSIITDTPDYAPTATNYHYYLFNNYLSTRVCVCFTRSRAN